MIDLSKLNGWERNFLADVEVRARARQPVSLQEKQTVWNIALKAGVTFTPQQVAGALKEGVDIGGTVDTLAV